jgi:hypothetical protein
MNNLELFIVGVITMVVCVGIASLMFQFEEDD